MADVTRTAAKRSPGIANKGQPGPKAEGEPDVFTKGSKAKALLVTPVAASAFSAENVTFSAGVVLMLLHAALVRRWPVPGI